MCQRMFLAVLFNLIIMIEDFFKMTTNKPSLVFITVSHISPLLASNPSLVGIRVGVVMSFSHSFPGSTSEEISPNDEN